MSPLPSPYLGLPATGGAGSEAPVSASADISKIAQIPALAKALIDSSIASTIRACLGVSHAIAMAKMSPVIKDMVPFFLLSEHDPKAILEVIDGSVIAAEYYLQKKETLPLYQLTAYVTLLRHGRLTKEATEYKADEATLSLDPGLFPLALKLADFLSMPVTEWSLEAFPELSESDVALEYLIYKDACLFQHINLGLFPQNPEHKRLYSLAVQSGIKRYPPDWAKSDETIMQCLGILHYASIELRNKASFVQPFIEKDGMAIQHVGDELKANRELFRPLALKAVKQNGQALAHLAEIYRDDEEIVAAAVSNCGDSLWNASDRLRANSKIVALALSQDRRAFDASRVPIDSEDYTRDILPVLQNLDLGVPIEGAILYAPPGTFASGLTQEKALEIVSKHPFILDHPDFATFASDKAVALAAVATNGEALACLPEYRDDDDVVLAAVQQCGKALFYASVRLRKNSIILKAAYAQSADSYEYSLAGFDDDDDDTIKDILSRNGLMLGYVPPPKQTVKSIVLKAVENDGRALREIPDTDISKDEQVMLSALRQTRSAFYIIAHINREKAYEEKFLTRAIRAWPEIFGSILSVNYHRLPGGYYGSPRPPVELLNNPKIRLAAGLFPLKPKPA